MYAEKNRHVCREKWHTFLAMYAEENVAKAMKILAKGRVESEDYPFAIIAGDVPRQEESCDLPFRRGGCGNPARFALEDTDGPPVVLFGSTGHAALGLLPFASVDGPRRRGCGNPACFAHGWPKSLQNVQ